MLGGVFEFGITLVLKLNYAILDLKREFIEALFNVVLTLFDKLYLSCAQARTRGVGTVGRLARREARCRTCYST